MQTKKSLREAIQSQLVSQSPEERKRKSAAIQQKLFGLDAFRKSDCVCFYVSLPTEVDTSSMIDQSLEMGKRVVVPLSDLENKELKLYQIEDRREDLRQGTFGVFEPRPDKTKPVDFKKVDCVVIPGVVFDKEKNRIGRGKGFYDRFLEKLGPQVFKIGLAFSFQVVQEIPHDHHDVSLNFVLTDEIFEREFLWK